MAVAAPLRPSVYQLLMDDKTLAAAIEDLETKLTQLKFCRGPLSGKLFDGYNDALAAAIAEQERRRT